MSIETNNNSDREGKIKLQMHTINLKILNIYPIMTVIKMLLANLKWFLFVVSFRPKSPK